MQEQENKTREDEVEEYRLRAEAAERALFERDVRDALERGLSGVRFTSASARRDVTSRVIAAGLPLEGGALTGLGELLERFREEDPDAFADANAEMPRFTDRMDAGTESDADARERIMAINDRSERRAAIAANLSLFRRG